MFEMMQKQQESIPVGCVPSPAVIVVGGGIPARGDVSAQGGEPARGASQHALRQAPPENRMTDRQV